MRTILILVWAALFAVASISCQQSPTPQPDNPAGADGGDSPAAENGVTRGKEGTFLAKHVFTIEVAEGAGSFDAWLPLPQVDDPHQEISDLEITVSNEAFTHEEAKDERGNTFLHVTTEGAPPAGTLTVTTTFTCRRWEVTAELDPDQTRPHTPGELEAMQADLAHSAKAEATPEIQAWARQVVGDEKNPITASRLIYDAVLERIEYHVKDPKSNADKTMKSSGSGWSVHTFEQKCGNCTDFHALYAAMSRTVGIPTRVVYGSFFKGPLKGVDKDQSYHCWIEFHAPGIGWVPLDVAVGDIFVDHEYNEHSRPRANLTVADGYQGPDPAMVSYYFGNLEERRVVWHRYRDLVLTPKQKGAPLLWNPKGYCEIDGKPVAVSRKLTFE